MKDPDLSKKHHSDPAALARTDVRPKLNENSSISLHGILALTGWAKIACRVLVLSSHEKIVRL
jgi:hypothetical protein